MHRSCRPILRQPLLRYQQVSRRVPGDTRSGPAIWVRQFAGVVLIALLGVIIGAISWQFLIPASADGIFAVLFVLALNSLGTARQTHTR